MNTLTVGFRDDILDLAAIAKAARNEPLRALLLELAGRIDADGRVLDYTEPTTGGPYGIGLRLAMRREGLA